MESIGEDYRRCDLPQEVMDMMDNLEKGQKNFDPQNPVRGFEIPFSEEQIPEPTPVYKEPWGPRWWKNIVNTCSLFVSFYRAFNDSPPRKVIYVDDMNPPASYGYLSTVKNGTTVKVSIILSYGTDGYKITGWIMSVNEDMIGDMSTLLYEKTQIDEYTIGCICAQLKTIL